MSHFTPKIMSTKSSGSNNMFSFTVSFRNLIFTTIQIFELNTLSFLLVIIGKFKVLLTSRLRLYVIPQFI